MYNGVDADKIVGNDIYDMCPRRDTKETASSQYKSFRTIYHYNEENYCRY